MPILQKHLDYDGCDGCHSYHGSGSGFQLLAGVDTEATCKACHGPSSGAVIAGMAPEAAVHDPAGVGVGNQGYITCRECHDNHSNEGGNTKLVGYDWDPVVDPSKSNVFAGPKIRVELKTSDISSPVYRDVTFVERPRDFKRPAPDSDGVCQVCHNAGPTSGPTVLQDHEWGDCTICHMHEDGFKKRQCVECHDEDALTRFPKAPVDAPTVLNTNLVNPGSHLKLTGGGGTPTGKPGYPVDPSDLDAADTIAWNAWLLTWTERCIQCHAGHSGDVIVPNNNAVGINYQRTGGIGLGGKYKETTGAAEYLSEAEVCWDCHGNNQSEWNGQAYNGYTVSTENWTTANFDAPNGEGNSVDVIPTRHALSIHTANDVDTPDTDLGEDEKDVRSSSVADNVNADGTLKGTGTRTLENVYYIRCSYCHDVHDTVAGSPTKGDTITAENGQTFTSTYLRGTWMPNAYTGTTLSGVSNAPEVPPWTETTGTSTQIRRANAIYYSSDGSTDGTNVNQNSTSLTVGSTTHNNWGHEGDENNSGGSREVYVSLPRLYTTSPGSKREGGFFIDQNAGWPTRTGGDGSAGNPYTFLSVAQTAGLCIMCHNEGTDNLEYAYEGATARLWRGANNGHSNSALGGSGAGSGNDIFNAMRDLDDGDEYGMHGQPVPDNRTSSGNDNDWGDSNSPTFNNDKPNDFLPFGNKFKSWEPGA